MLLNEGNDARATIVVVEIRIALTNGWLKFDAKPMLMRKPQSNNV